MPGPLGLMATAGPVFFIIFLTSGFYFTVIRGRTSFFLHTSCTFSPFAKVKGSFFSGLDLWLNFFLKKEKKQKKKEKRNEQRTPVCPVLPGTRPSPSPACVWSQAVPTSVLRPSQQQ